MDAETAQLFKEEATPAHYAVACAYLQHVFTDDMSLAEMHKFIDDIVKEIQDDLDEE